MSKLKIGLIDADLLDNGTRHPNLALMKISAFQKNKGNNVVLLETYEDIESFDKVYISKVFSFTKVPGFIYNHPKVVKGGTGFFEDDSVELPPEIEFIMPDYNLYLNYIDKKIAEGARRSRFADYLDYSIGFTTRGCFRKCNFCVNKKYDRAFRHSKVSDFLDLSRPKIYLWDDNFFAYPHWQDILQDLIDTNKPFQFRQGLDIRLLTRKKAKMLSKAKYNGDFIFAFDHIEDKELIINKLKLWRQYTKKSTKLYVLTAYDSQDHIDIINTFKRIEILMKFGCLPYIMRYESETLSYRDSKYSTLYTQIARWCNQPNFFKKMSFRQFCLANQKYAKNQTRNCACYQAMLDFEVEFPAIAAEYFDLRFEDLNRYG